MGGDGLFLRCQNAGSSFQNTKHLPSFLERKLRLARCVGENSEKGTFLICICLIPSSLHSCYSNPSKADSQRSVHLPHLLQASLLIAALVASLH